MEKKLNKNSIALAGEFAVLSQLMLKGFNANMTLGHTKGIDILVSDPESGKMYKLEVKTSYTDRKDTGVNSKLFGKYAYEWMMDKKHEKLHEPNLFYCFVKINKKDQSFKFYILPSKIVAVYVRKQHALWLADNKSHRDTDRRVFRLGFEKEKYKIKTHSIKKCENNWRFK